MNKGKILGVILIVLLIVFIVFTRKGLFGKGDVAEEQNRYTATFILLDMLLQRMNFQRRLQHLEKSLLITIIFMIFIMIMKV